MYEFNYHKVDKVDAAVEALQGAEDGKLLDEATVRKELEGNICRCTGYHNIVKSVQAGAKAMGGNS